MNGKEGLTSHRHIPVEAFLQGDQGFRPFDTFDFLQLVVQNKFELIEIFGHHFEEHAVITGGIVEANDFRNLFQAERFTCV